MPEDPIDHCAEAARLRRLLTDAVSGAGVKRVRFDKEEIENNAPNIAALKDLIKHHDEQCAIAQGVTLPRRRFAMGVRMKPQF